MSLERWILIKFRLMDMSLAWILRLEFWRKNENNPARVLDIQKYVNRQYESCSKRSL